MPQLFSNNAATVLTTAINTTFTTLAVTDASLFPSPTGGDFFNLALIGLNANGQEASWEILRCTARTGNSLTVVRAQEGTVGIAWGVGTRVEVRMTAGFANTTASHLVDVANPHATTKAQVGLANVDNTSDANKPVSTATSTAIGLKIDTAAKDVSGGVPGLTLFKLNLRNVANTVTSWFTTASTVARTWTLPDKDGTVAMTSDITGTNSGTNTGDQTIPTTLPASDVYAWAKAATKPSYTAGEVGAQVAGTYATGTGSASGVNTGDETGAGIRTKLGIATLSGSNTGDQTLPTLSSLGGQAALVSGTNIKTVNSTSLLGSGNIVTGDVTLAGVQTLTNKTISGAANTITADGTNAVGFRTIPQVSQSAAYTTVLADSGKHILHPSVDTTARTFTIPSNASVAYPIGTALTFVNQASGGVVTIAITTDTMRLAGAGTTGSRTLAANGVATAIKLTATEWIISGSGLT